MAVTTTLDDDELTGAPARLRFGVDLPDPKFRSAIAVRESVRRAELLGRLEQDRDRPLVLLTAPAGYGKTTLLTQWTHESGRPCAWVTLDRTDADRRVLADSVAGALAAIGIQPGLRRSFMLVLDDGHVIGPEALGDAVLGVLDWLPDGSQLAVASRCEPALPLSRMRAQRLLVEIGSEGLSMSAVEAASLLRHEGLDPEFTPVQTLVQRTEGWPVALELAMITGARRDQLTAPVAQFSGDDHVISEYFRTELLASLSAATVRFLTRSSVLERLSGSLCDEVLGRRRSASLLAALSRGNVPLAPLDSSHEWYRLHGLFREMLQTELRRSEPEIASDLHRRAEAWYRRAGDIDRALGHAVSATDVDGAGELLWAHLLRYLGEGRNPTVQRWLGAVGADQLSRSAPLALAAAHSNLALGSISVAEQWARSAAARLSDTPTQATAPELAGVLLIQAWAARAGAREMGEVATRAYDLLRDDSPWRASCCFLRGTAALLIGDGAEAEQRLQEGAVRGAVLAPDAASLCLAQLAVAAAERGQPDVASDFAARARSVVQAHGLASTPASALMFAVWAAATMREGRVDEAKAAASECLALLDVLDESLAWLGAETRIVLARVSLSLGDVAGARELLADASRLARRVPDVVVFHGWFDDAWNQFDARAEGALSGVASLTTAELRVLRFLPTHYSFHEIAQRLHVSSNTVKTHVHAVYRKLDASSRSEAVAQATDAGLLGS